MPDHLSYRAEVTPADCDVLGHMNVSRYFAAASDAVESLQAAIGLTLDDVLHGRRLGFAVVHAESDFLSEVLAGEVLVMHSAFLELGRRSVLMRHRLFSETDGRKVFETTFRSVMLDLEHRRAAPIPDEVRAAAAQFMAG